MKERIALQGSPTRCPYCHDACRPEQDAVCHTCLARHHAACWDEAGRCGSCGSEARLERVEAERRSSAIPGPRNDRQQRASSAPQLGPRPRASSSRRPVPGWLPVSIAPLVSAAVIFGLPDPVSGWTIAALCLPLLTGAVAGLSTRRLVPSALTVLATVVPAWIAGVAFPHLFLPLLLGAPVLGLGAGLLTAWLATAVANHGVVGAGPER